MLRRQSCLTQNIFRSTYLYGYAEEINSWGDQFAAGPTFADRDALDEECRHVLGSDWRAWNAELWEEWHWVFQIPSSKLGEGFI